MIVMVSVKMFYLLTTLIIIISASKHSQIEKTSNYFLSIIFISRHIGRSLLILFT